jgi:hypothetical protein
MGVAAMSESVSWVAGSKTVIGMLEVTGSTPGSNTVRGYQKHHPDRNERS